MRTIAVIALKGGSGKTTVAAHMTLAAHLRGLKVLAADVDPQHSTSQLLAAREGDGPRFVAVEGAGLFATQLGAVGAGMDLLVIDTAAGAVEDVGQALVLADLSLLVVRPTLLDLAALARTVDIVRRLKKTSLVVVNQAPPARDGVEAPLVKRALKALEYMRLDVAPIILRARTIYQTALETGRSAEEAFDESAAKEIADLWAYVEPLAFSAREAPALSANDR